MSSNQNNERQS